jgi:hypothetical protein
VRKSCYYQGDGAWNPLVRAPVEALTRGENVETLSSAQALAGEELDDCEQEDGAQK